VPAPGLRTGRLSIPGFHPDMGLCVFVRARCCPRFDAACGISVIWRSFTGWFIGGLKG